ncbi:hypothetical protein BH10PAT1_BH10PAT1_3960 [soil metagenome]
MTAVVINSFPSNISNDAFDINVTIKGAKSGINYLRAEFYKDGTNNYFGETFNGKDWYSGNEGQNYYSVEVKSANTETIVKARIGNPNLDNYPGAGIYKLKIKRYTASGNAANDSENAVDIQINYNLETPTPTIEPTIAPTFSPIPTVIETPKPTPQVLAVQTEISPSPISIVESKSVIKAKNSFPYIPAICFAIGLFLIGITIYMLYNKVNVRDFKKKF